MDAQIVDALIGGTAGHAVIHIGAPLSGGVAGYGVPLRRDAGGHVIFPAVFVHGVHGLVAAAEAVLIDTGLKAHDVPETVERAAGAEASMPETAEDVDVLHRAVRGQKEHIGAEILSAGTYENVLIVAVAPSYGVLRVIREAVGSAVGLAVREIPRLALGKRDRYAVIGEPGGHESVLGLGTAVRPVAGAGLHEHRLIIPSVAPRDRGDGLEGSEGAVPVGAEHGEIQREVFLRHRPGPECRQINGDAAVVFILRRKASRAPGGVMGIELPGRAPAQGGDKVTLVHVEAVQKLQVVRPLAGLKIVVIYRVVDEVAGPAQHADGKAQQAVVPIALPCDLHVLRVGRFSRFGGVQRGLHVISEALHDLPVVMALASGVSASSCGT